MTTVLFLVINLAMLVVLFLGLYLLGRVFIPELAEKNSFFSSPKLGRIKARRRSGRIVVFFDNLEGKGRHVNKRTGKVEPGEINSNSLWWKLFGVIFIGLDDIYEYKIAIDAEESSDGVLKYTEKDASSIFLEGSYSLTTVVITRDGVKLKVRLQLKLTTLDAAKGLSLPLSWTIPVFTTVLGKCRSFFGTKETTSLISDQNEGIVRVGLDQVENSDFISEILSLNKPATGNVSLEEICGQRIDAVNIVYLDFADIETERAFLAPFVARRKAAATTLTGNAEAEIYRKKHESLGGTPLATAQVIAAEKHSEMGGLTTLVNGGGALLSLPIKQEKRKEKD